MSELFEFGVCFEVRGGHISNRYEEITQAQADYIEDATNNHDRLEQENAELRGAIEAAMRIKDLWLPFHIVTNEHEGEAIPLHRMYNRFDQLLNK